MQSGRPGRDRPRRDDNHSPMQQPRNTSRFDEKPSSRMKNPPSRHLWVGNLAQDIAQSTLVDHFFRFGELESVAFQPGRSFAFVNYKREEDAIAALESLQGFSLAGFPLRVEFAKSDKSSARDQSNYRNRDELQPPTRRSTFSPRESRVRHGSPDAFFPDSSRTSDNNKDHPSEILWIGFPSFLKVTETILWKQFSPFGEIDKITVFQGRTYAFVQFRTIASACQAKETLQGKLFGNPRVHICFSRNDNTSSSAGRRDMGPNSPSSQHFKPNGQPGSSERDRFDRHFATFSEDPSRRPSHLPDMEYAGTSFRNFSRKESSWTHTNNDFEEKRVHDLGMDVGALQGQPYYRSPGRDGNDNFHRVSPQKLTRKIRFPEDQWDLPEDTYSFREPKKMRIDSFPNERELPDYPFLDEEQGKHGIPGMAPNFPRADEIMPAIRHRRLPEHPLGMNLSSLDRHDISKPSHDTYLPSPSPLTLNPLDRKRNSLELRKSGMKDVWKWEGTIAKGGTPVCRARCFPVGKVMDVNLPEFLDCTARTGLDMLAKHYYQAANSWVVFFVAASDADMGFYNEFMHHLGEKQRAAVAKLDERNTLFLVPPSDFSENVLKVPGKLSISGVVLSLEPSSPTVASLPPVNDSMHRSHMYANVDSSMAFREVELPSSELSSSASLMPLVGNMTTSAPSLMPTYDHGTGCVSDQGGYQNEYQPNSRAATMAFSCPPQPPSTPGPSSRDFTLHSFPVSEGYQHSIFGRVGSDAGTGIYNNRGSGISYPGGNNSAAHENKLPTVAPPHLSGLRPDQLAQLASSLLGPQMQSAKSSLQAAPGVSRPSESVGYHPEDRLRLPTRYTGTQAFQLPSNSSSSPFSQLQQPQQAESSQTLAGSGGMGNVQDESEADPQKRLQATLQLAATLLQQIQQGKGT